VSIRAIARSTNDNMIAVRLRLPKSPNKLLKTIKPVAITPEQINSTRLNPQNIKFPAVANSGDVIMPDTNRLGIITRSIIRLPLSQKIKATMTIACQRGLIDSTLDVIAVI